MPAGHASRAQGGELPAAPAEVRARDGGQFVRSFISHMLVFGIVGYLVSSRFPIWLGAFLFFTDDELIEWSLGKVGIRFVPEALGPEFIKAFVFLAGLWVLLASWRGSAPDWLPLPTDASWPLVAGAALLCAALKLGSTAIVCRLLPRIGIRIAAARQGLAIMVVLGMLILMVFAIAPAASWLGLH